MIETLQPLGISLALGLLVGLQRERVRDPLAGIRTFPIVSLFGALLAMLSTNPALGGGGWVLLVGGVGGVVALLVMGNLIHLRVEGDDANAGQTTEAALLLMYAVGAATVLAPPVVAVSASGVLMLLLQQKPGLRRFVDRLSDKDLHAIAQFVLLSLVILPLIPDRTIGPYDVINPREVWWMVVLIVGIALGGYIAYKFLGERVGMLFGGFFGGLISSTATTVSYARLFKSTQGLLKMCSVVILGACSVLLIRVIIEIAVVSPKLFAVAIWPLSVVTVGAFAVTLWVYKRGDDEEQASVERPEQETPGELKSALFFALIYALVLLAMAWSKDVLGDSGLYLIAIISGLTDMDAITLSSARLVETGSISASTAWRVVLVAVMSNSVVKWIAAGTLGGRGLLKWVSVFFGSSAVISLLLIFLWPG